MKLRALAPVTFALLLAACGEGGWFGSSDAPPLPGERISILQHNTADAASPELADIRPELPPAVDGDWPQAYGGPARAPGHRALADAPSLAWSRTIGEGENNEERRIVYPPVASSTAIFTLDAGGVIAAWSPEDGKQLWRVDPTPKEEEDGFGGGLAYDDGMVYFAGGFAEALALDAATGEQRWRAELPTPSRAAPTVADGRAFVVTIDNRLIALDAATGRTLWTFDSPAATAALLGGAAPAAADGAAVAAMTTGEIIAFRAVNGRVTWDDALTAVRRIGVSEAIPAARALPVISEGQVIAVGAAGFSTAIDFATGTRIWDRGVGGIETPAVVGGYVFLATDGGQLLALRRQDGQVVWATDMAAAAGDTEERGSDIYVNLYAGPIAAGGKLAVVRGDGKLLFFRPSDGALDSRIDLPARTVLAPIVADRTLYVLTETGVLAAYR